MVGDFGDGSERESYANAGMTTRWAWTRGLANQPNSPLLHRLPPRPKMASIGATFRGSWK